MQQADDKRNVGIPEVDDYKRRGPAMDFFLCFCKRFKLFRLVKKGLYIAVTFIFMGFIFVACGGERNKNMSINDKELLYLALGDSYTIGEAVDEDQRWPVQLVEKLRTDSFNISDPHIIAKTGWTTDELKAAIKEAVPERDYSLVSLMIGVNNQYRGRDHATFRTELEELIDIAIGCAAGVAGNVIVLSIPDWGVTPFAEGRDREKIAAELDLFNSVIREECIAYGVQYFDVTGISREALSDISLLADDGLHPSGKMYKLWVEKLYPCVNELMMKSSSEE